MKVDGNDPLGTALRGLEVEKASAGFTDRVMRQLESRRSPAQRRAGTLALAGAALALIAGIVVLRNLGSPDAAELAREAQLIRQEQQTLAEELESLRLRAAETAPVLYLGGDDEFDLVLDLAPLVGPPIPGLIPVATGGPEPLDL
jgi:hypothetical protein